MNTVDTTSLKPELLAPCGSLEAFFAALECGADAVYVGLKDFSARAKAKNVSLKELERMLAYAHLRKRRVFLTLNTLIKEAELPLLIDTLAAVTAMGVDAVILQDMAVWRLAREHFPELELHASTQLTIHNAAGVKKLEDMGFSRVVLARELSLEEIVAIRRQTSIGLEHFIHGAHCFSLSGQCSFSSWLGGMSGNRGRCAQPCRRRYRYRGKEGYYFSPNDLSAVDLLPNLIEAGVISFKIEGRMKSAEYVGNVVTAYRKVLDATEESRPQAVASAKDLLRVSFGRLPTKGFLPGTEPADIINPAIHGATGLLLGKLDQVQVRRMTLLTRHSLHVGDRVRVQPATDRPGKAFTVRELFVGNKAVKQVSGKSQVSIAVPPGMAFRKGDNLFKVSTGQAFALSDAACRKRLAEVGAVRYRLELHVSLPSTHELRLKADCAGITVERTFPMESFPAKQQPLSSDVLIKVFSKTGEAPCVLTELFTTGLPEIVIPPSRLNAIRREFYRDLTHALAIHQQNATESRRQEALSKLIPATEIRKPEKSLLAVVIGHIREQHLLKSPEVSEIYLPLIPGLCERVDRHRVDRMIWDLPVAIFDRDWPSYQEEVTKLLELGFRRFRLQNLGQFCLFSGHNNLSLEAGYRLQTLNSQAALAWREMGFSSAISYLEDDRDNLRELLARNTGLPLSVTVYANVPMMLSRMPVRGVKAGQPLVSDRGEGYRVETRYGLSIVRSEQDFSLLGAQHELQAMGCHRFIVDLTHIGSFSKQGQRIISAAIHDDHIPKTSSFNFFRQLL